jgi:hypothetical protein
MNLEERLQQKLKDLEDLRTKLNALEDQKNKMLQQALEIQGAAKQLAELINVQKEEAQKDKPAA